MVDGLGRRHGLGHRDQRDPHRALTVKDDQFTNPDASSAKSRRSPGTPVVLIGWRGLLSWGKGAVWFLAAAVGQTAGSAVGCV
jgi:hypothetical protein